MLSSRFSSRLSIRLERTQNPTADLLNNRKRDLSPIPMVLFIGAMFVLTRWRSVGAFRVCHTVFRAASTKPIKSGGDCSSLFFNQVRLSQRREDLFLFVKKVSTCSQPKSASLIPFGVSFHRWPSQRLFSSAGNDGSDDLTETVDWKPGQPVIVEIVSFGPLGASVHVVAQGHSPDNLPPEDAEWPVLGLGLISQQELSYFRAARDYVDVLRGEVLPGYVEDVREQDSKLRIGLRAFGGKQKAQDIGQQIMDLLETKSNGTLSLGDKSSPADIAKSFPGVSKASFKKALSALFKQGKIQKPGSHEVRSTSSSDS